MLLTSGRSRYAAVRGATGWSVIDISRGEAVTIGNAPQVGLTEMLATATANGLNDLAEHQRAVSRRRQALTSLIEVATRATGQKYVI
jgi:hypothetical protein